MGAQHSKKKKPTGHKRKQGHDWTFFSDIKCEKSVIFIQNLAKFYIENKMVRLSQLSFLPQNTVFKYSLNTFLR